MFAEVGGGFAVAQRTVFQEGHAGDDGFIAVEGEADDGIRVVAVEIDALKLPDLFIPVFRGDGDFLVTGEPDTMTSVLRYITKVRAQQSFRLSDVLRSLLLIPPALRERGFLLGEG